MASTPDPTDRLRKALGALAPIVEKRMFGGTCFMWNERMLCGTGKAGFLFRVGKESDAAALSMPGATPMIHGGRRMAGYVWVDPARCDFRALGRWVDLARGHVEGLAKRETRRSAGSKR